MKAQEKLYMNSFTGEVGTADDWRYETETGDWVSAVARGEAIEVEKDENGDWVEVA